ncbi:unnamed protein product [Danaus chrysippus]|uniref:(African queen) hypothetical protein n=1 Tax=Danaus chrysippus TaxID=151541 RepID=A0A8J2QPR7_9NEOP|nr:unnamed protein product [Danaus chrysippus]
MSNLDTITNNIRKNLEKENNKPPPQPTQSVENIEKKFDALKSEIKNLGDRFKEDAATKQPQKPIQLGEHLLPITERLKAVASDIKSLREEKKDTTPTQMALSIGTEMAITEMIKSQAQVQKNPSYAQAAKKSPVLRQPNHTIIVSSTDTSKTGDNIINMLKTTLDIKNSGARTVWHLLLNCPRYQGSRRDLENLINTTVDMEILPTILCDKKTREPFLAYADKILRAAAKRYSNADRDRAAEEQIIISGIDPTPNSRHIEPPTQVGMPRQKIESILSMGESGIPGLRTKSVALYMDTPYEKLGISFCSNTGPNSVSIAPGLASIIKGNSGRTAMRRKKLEAIETLLKQGLPLAICCFLLQAHKTLSELALALLRANYILRASFY